MASINLTVRKNHQIYLIFFAEEYLKFVCMPNIYGPAVRIFTKTSKISSIVREVYVDDSYLQGGLL